MSGNKHSNSSVPIQEPHIQEPLGASESIGSKPWYKEFWAWFILTPLIVVVCVSTFTVTVAVKNADDRVLDDYYKEGRLINMRLDEDLAANQLALLADIVIDSSISEVSLHLQNNQQAFPESLILELSHPSDQQQDHQLTLQHIAKGRYRAELEQALNYRWYLRLRPVVDDGVNSPLWRLRGEIDMSKQANVRLSADF